MIGQAPITDSAKTALEQALERGDDVLMLSKGDIEPTEIPCVLVWSSEGGRRLVALLHWWAGVLPAVPDPLTKIIAGVIGSDVTAYAVADLRPFENLDQLVRTQRAAESTPVGAGVIAVRACLRRAGIDLGAAEDGSPCPLCGMLPLTFGGES